MIEKYDIATVDQAPAMTLSKFVFTGSQLYSQQVLAAFAKLENAKAYLAELMP